MSKCILSKGFRFEVVGSTAFSGLLVFGIWLVLDLNSVQDEIGGRQSVLWTGSYRIWPLKKVFHAISSLNPSQGYCSLDV